MLLDYFVHLFEFFFYGLCMYITFNFNQHLCSHITSKTMMLLGRLLSFRGRGVVLACCNAKAVRVCGAN